MRDNGVAVALHIEARDSTGAELVDGSLVARAVHLHFSARAVGGLANTKAV